MAAIQGLVITTEDLKTTATVVRQRNATMDEKLQDIKRQMNDLEASSWHSDAATEIKNAMNNLQGRFEEYKGVLNSYAEFLDNTAQRYEIAEGSIKNNAAEFHSR